MQAQKWNIVNLAVVRPKQAGGPRRPSSGAEAGRSRAGNPGAGGAVDNSVNKRLMNVAVEPGTATADNIAIEAVL